MTAILKYAPAGFAGRVSRPGSYEITESRVVSATNTPTAYGQAVILNASGLAALPISSTSAIYGVIVQSYPVQQTAGGMSASFGAGTPTASNPDNILVSGYVNVALNTADTAPVAGGAVYVQLIAETGYVVGQFRTAASGTSGNSLLVTNAKWASTGVTASGIAEVAFNI